MLKFIEPVIDLSRKEGAYQMCRHIKQSERYDSSVVYKLHSLEKRRPLKRWTIRSHGRAIIGNHLPVGL